MRPCPSPPRNILDFNATYDVIDSKSKALVGSLKREGLHSIFQNKWNIMDTSGSVIGSLSRKVSIGDKYSLDLSGDPEKKLDRRLAIAMLPLFDAGEDR